MTTSPTRIGFAYLCAVSMMVAGFPRVAHPQNEIVGSITGKVFDGDHAPLANVVVKAHAMTTNRSLASTTTNERGAFLISDAPASIYALTLTHEGVDYPVSQRIDARAGMTFLLDNCLRLDKQTKTASVIPGDCAGELIAQAKVVTIGPHRFLAVPQEGEPLSLFPDEPEGPGPEGPEGEDPGIEAPTDEVMDPQSPGPDLAEPDADGDPDADVTYEPLEDEGELDGIDTDAPGLQIAHDGIECLQHDQFPLVDSAVTPGPEVAVCRVYFRSDKYPDFYFVEANEVPETPEDFRAILPKPSPETARVIYYVEAVNEEFEIFQTPENDPEVVDDACTRDPAGYYQGADAPSIVVGATTAGAAAVPPGFQALGITGFISAAGVTTAVTAAAAAGGAAAGAGISTGLIVVVSGAAVAGGGAVVNNVVNNGGENEASTP